MKNKKLFFGDVVVNIIVLALCVAGVAVVSFVEAKDEYVNVYVGDSLYATYSLDENITLSPNDNKTIIEIKDGSACITESDCPDGHCKKMQPITRKSVSSVVCLPNKVAIVKTKTLTKGGVDVFAG